MSPLNITQPLDSIRYMVYNGYYKVMSNIPINFHQLPFDFELLPSPGKSRGDLGAFFQPDFIATKRRVKRREKATWPKSSGSSSLVISKLELEKREKILRRNIRNVPGEVKNHGKQSGMAKMKVNMKVDSPSHMGTIMNMYE